MSKPTQEERDRVVQEIVQRLYQAGANAWPVQDKGVLLAAIKQQLAERPAGRDARQ